MKLTNVKINKYKSYINMQSLRIEDTITCLVGKNESGKSAFLEALAKFRYFLPNNYQYNIVSDYPRVTMKSFQASNDDAVVVECSFEIDKELINSIEADVGSNVLINNEIIVKRSYKNPNLVYEFEVSENNFILNISNKYIPDNEEKVHLLKDIEQLENVQGLFNYCVNKEELKSLYEILQINYMVYPQNTIKTYLTNKYFSKYLPYFWYFNEYYEMPAKINLNYVSNGTTDQSFTQENLDIVRALFELANINIRELLGSSGFESYKAELEGTSNQITDEFIEYWKTNSDLDIQFDINNINSEKYLEIRVYNKKHRLSLPLGNRSKGFIWFFSFLVWFNKIKNVKDKNKQFIVLLDEPGLNLHASAQRDLLRFIDDKLIPQYQVIYTTHSPFMVDSNKLNTVRTIYDSLDPKEGSKISEAIQEKDTDTLFPLQAALGYDISQNLYISKNNLIVEGPADLIYLTAMSGHLSSIGREGLRDDITIVPVGGLDKVATFVSLLRGNSLQIVCLLDTFLDQKSKRRLDDLIAQKIIREKNIRFFNEFVQLKNDIACIEDLFEKSEYLGFFNAAFKEFNDISISSIKHQDETIIDQINRIIGKERFNHYRPANIMLQLGLKSSDFSENTLTRFEIVCKEINRLF